MEAASKHGSMKLGHPRVVEQCDVLCGLKLLHLRILFDGETHLYDLHIMRVTSWRALSQSSPGLQLSLDRAKELAEEQALVSCGVAQLKFKWEVATVSPSPGRAR
jgi:hypothetical protein